MKAIRVKYFGPSNCKGSRLIASDGDGNRKEIGYPYGFSAGSVELYWNGAKALIEKMGWHGNWIGGYDGEGWVFVCIKGEHWDAERFAV